MYGFCCRGAGNFSYRFGEVLSHGRIPVLVDTDCVLPYEHLIDWNKHAIIVNENDDIANVIIEFHKNTNEETLINMQKQNRKLWEEYFTPLSFIKHIGDFCNGNR